MDQPHPEGQVSPSVRVYDYLANADLGIDLGEKLGEEELIDLSLAIVEQVGVSPEVAWDALGVYRSLLKTEEVLRDGE